MANKIRGFVPVVLDRERNFRFNFDAFELVEETLNVPLSSLNSDVKMKDLKVMIWAGLIHEHPSLKLENVGSLIDEAESIQYVTEKMSEAIQLGMSGKQQNKKNEKKVTKAK